MIETIIATLTPPQAWTKGAFARTVKGNVIGPECANAVCFCMLGALIRTDPDFYPESRDFILAAIPELFPTRIATSNDFIGTFNDHPDTTHEDVLRVLHRARELELAATPSAPIARNVTLPADTPIPPEALAALTAG